MQSFDAFERTFVRGEGNHLIDARGRRVYDAVSSIWTIVHGHCHPVLVDAIARQAGTLDHATALGASNPVAETLAGALCDLTGMDYAFFASDGASAIEAAAKMAIQYWRQTGQPQRTRFVRLADAYHGDTAAAMSLSDLAVFKSHFGAITFDTLPLERAGDLDAPDLAAVFVEPLVQAAAGMQILPREAYAPLRDRATLLIVDEIATGFGRTGTMFAFEQLDLRPDLICVGKGITGGTLALSATLATAQIFTAFLGEIGERRQFFHGHSYAANPIACAAALASLALFERENTLERARAIARIIERRLSGIAEYPTVRQVRNAGTMTGIERDEEAQARAAAARLYELGHFTRSIGPVVQFVPPLSSSDAEIHAFFDACEVALA
jgi:adenosylmethionine-8-amino-7-oxononanoate aminotransferase